MIHEGGCHCGAIGYSYRTDAEPGNWLIRACQCAFCRAQGARTTSDPGGHVEFRAGDPTALRLYRFGQRTADFLLCGVCGVYIGASIRTARGCFGIVNVNTLKPYPQGLNEPQRVSYEGESAAQRASRREQRWTPCSHRGGRAGSDPTENTESAL